MNPMNNVIGIVLAGGIGGRLMPLTSKRAKPAVPFGANHRIIDFVMNNFVNSKIKNIKVLTQVWSQSVNQHIKNLYKSNSLYGISINTVEAQQKRGCNMLYEGTADAVYQNLDLLGEGMEVAAIFAGDHIFAMDLRQLLVYHRAKNSDFTICAIPCPVAIAANKFGVMEIDSYGQVVAYTEKPDYPREIPGKPGFCWASMGNCLVNIPYLINILTVDSQQAQSKHDLAGDVLPRLVEQGAAVFAYDFTNNKIPGQSQNYWRDVGTISAFWEANMDLCNIEPEINPFNPEWPIRTFPNSLPPFKHGLNPDNALIGSGSITNGCRIVGSVLGQSVTVDKDSCIVDSVVFPDVTIGKNVRIFKSIIDKDVYIPDNTEIGHSCERDRARHMEIVDGITIIPKGYKF